MVEGDRPHSDLPLIDDLAGTPDAAVPVHQEALPRDHPRVRRAVELLVVLALVLAGASYYFDLGEHTGLAAPDPASEPAEVAAPEVLDLPDAAPVAAVARPLPAGPVDRDAVVRAIGRLVEAKKLGRRVGVLVADASGRPVWQSGPRVAVPASTIKLLTVTAALERLGPQHRFETRVVRSGRTLTLVGGGDPLLSSRPLPDSSYPTQRASLRALATQVAAELGPVGQGRLGLQYDDSLFSGPAATSHWPGDYLTDDVVSPITALWVEEGRVVPDDAERSEDPSASAAAAFARELRKAGVRVGAPTPGAAPQQAEPVAAVRSPTLAQIVQHVLEVSDNEGAEVLLRQVALAAGRPGSFSDGVAAVRETLAGVGISLPGAVWYDGSGLSRDNRISPATLVDVLATSLDPAHPELAGVAAGLPVAGFNGSLSTRFAVRADAGLGLVRAKSGTLTGVHALAGIVTSRDGTVMTYSVITDRVKLENTLAARDKLDQISAALAACTCAAR